MLITANDTHVYVRKLPVCMHKTTVALRTINGWLVSFTAINGELSSQSAYISVYKQFEHVERRNNMATRQTINRPDCVLTRASKEASNYMTAESHLFMPTLKLPPILC